MTRGIHNGELRRARQRGLTMIETLITLAMMTMMMVAVWTSFRTLQAGMEFSERTQQRYSILRNCVSRMGAEISMSYLSWNRPADEEKHYTLFEGYDQSDEDRLTFSSFAHVRLRRDAKESDQSMIQYVLDADPEDSSRKHVYRRESNRLMGDTPVQMAEYAPAYIFCEDVTSLDFKYFDPRLNDWREEWRTTSQDQQPDRLPPRVRIELGFIDEFGEARKYVTQTVLFMQEKIDMSK